MAAAPAFKVYNSAKQYIAACKHVEDAAALAALNGNGTTIRAGHSVILWTEGAESQPAGESYDFVAEVAEQRRHAHFVKSYDQLHGAGAAAKLIGGASTMGDPSDPSTADA